MEYLKGLIVASAVLGAGVILAPSATAQQADEGRESITASPSSQSFTIDAGATKNGSMEIINDGDVGYDLVVYARPYSVTNEAYDPNFSTIRPNTDVQNWIQFEKTKLRLEAGQKTTVNYTVRVPEGAAPGGHYGVLFAETQQRDIGTTGVARQKRVGNLIYATVNGNLARSGELKEFLLPFWQTKAPVVSAARVTNTGNVDFDTRVTTVAKDIFGRTKFTYTGDPIVLPETTRLIEMNWEKSPGFGLFKVQQNVEFLDQKQSNGGFVLIAPAWFPIVLGAALIFGVAYAIRTRRKTRR